MRKLLVPLLVVPVVIGLLALREEQPTRPVVVAAAPPAATPPTVPRREPPPPPPRSPEETRALEATRVHPRLAEKVDAIYARAAARSPTETERAFWTQELVDERPEVLVGEYVALLSQSFAQVYRRPPQYDELRHFTDFLDAGSPLL